MVVVLCEWGVGENPIPKAREFDLPKPNTESTRIPAPMAQSLTSAGLSIIESRGPQPANNNFAGWIL